MKNEIIWYKIYDESIFYLRQDISNEYILSFQRFDGNFGKVGLDNVRTLALIKYGEIVQWNRENLELTKEIEENVVDDLMKYIDVDTIMKS